MTIAALCTNNTNCKENNLLKDVDGNLRYYGSNPNNYISFNGEMWRIVGVFNTKKNETDSKSERRIKIVREKVLESRVFDTGFSNIWKGSDLEIYLNSTSNDGYYYKLNQDSKNQIEKAVWNIVGVDNHVEDSSAEGINKLEKKNVSEAIVGLISLSDYGYASGNTRESIFEFENTNWLSGNYSTIVGFTGDGGNYIWTIKNNKIIMDQVGNTSLGVLPAVYLKSNIKLAGLGTISNPYKIG